MFLKPFNIIANNRNGGLIQTVPDAVSIDKLRKTRKEYTDLRAYFYRTFGGSPSDQDKRGQKKAFRDARIAFV